MSKANAHRCSPEVRERAVRLVRQQVPRHTSQWAAIAAIAPTLGCTPETWRRFDDLECATLEWVAWFKQQRLLEPLGYVPPAAFDAQYYSTATTHTSVGVLN